MTHPGSDVLAEFRAGLITGRHGARVSAHLTACERCAGLCDQLAELSALLAAVPAPVMPDAVAQRLGGVFAAEAAKRDSSERAGGDSAPDRAAGSPRGHWDFRLVALRVLAPAAAVVLLAAGGYGLSRTGGSSTSSAAAGSAAAGSAASPAATSARAGAAGAASAGATSRHAVVPAIEAPLRLAVVTSNTDYQRATLARQLERELALYPRAAGNARDLAPGPLRGCVLRVTRDARPGTLVLVERAHFQGQPAIVIVAVSGDRDAAWVTTSACSATSDHVLAATTLPGTSAP